jgi:nucleotide-binding universal stress UspA family protein
MLAIRTILHPTDFSERSEHAFHLACSLARDHGARVVLMHVVSLPLPSRSSTAWRRGIRPR